MDKFYGEIPVGKTFLKTLASGGYIIFVVSYRTESSLNQYQYDQFYNISRNVLLAVLRHNRPQSRGSGSSLLSPRVPIENIFFPILTYQNIFVVEDDLIMSTTRFGVQTNLAVKQLHKTFRKRTLKNSTNKSNLLCEIDTGLIRAHGKLLNKANRLKIFVNYISTGELAYRGLLDDTEIEWLVEACASTTTDTASPFKNNRRLQRLATISFSALNINKYFTLNETLQIKLRAAMVTNIDCFNWLLKMASVGSITLWPTVELSSLGNLTRIDSGASCLVFKTATNQVVKLFHISEQPENILQEFALMSLMSHRNVLPILGAGFGTYDSVEKQYFCVLPYADKGSLFSLLKKIKLDFQKKFLIITQIANALRYLHDCNIIHRDLKSLNVLLNSDFHVYVADVGSARLNATSDLMTLNIGTPIYMAPEVFFTQQYTPKIDVYSFGVLLFEVITETLPFAEYKSFEIPMLVKKGTRPIIPNYIAKPWVKLMKRCWHEKPSKRPTFAVIQEMIMNNVNVPFEVANQF